MTSLSKAIGLAVGATVSAIVKQKLRDVEEARQQAEAVAAVEYLRLKVVINQAEGELERKDYSAACTRLLDETESWGEDVDWPEKVVDLRDQIRAQVMALAELAGLDLPTQDEDDHWDEDNGFGEDEGD